MPQAVTAVYENGILKPLRDLPLQEHQQVLIIIVPLDTEQKQTTYDPERVAEMERQANAWLSQQPTDVRREPLPLSSAARQAIDQAFDETLVAIHHRTIDFDDEEIASDVAAALVEVRSASTPERQRLETEVQALLDEIATDAA